VLGVEAVAGAGVGAELEARHGVAPRRVRVRMDGVLASSVVAMISGRARTSKA
jgi:hypothetical protein